jgi:hypothetical protein
MTRDEIRKFILRGLKSDRVRWWGASMVPPDLRFREQRERWRVERKRAALGIYRYDPGAWLGRQPSGHERHQFRDELERMQRNGLVRIETGKRRVTYVRLLNVLTEVDVLNLPSLVEQDPPAGNQ